MDPYYNTSLATKVEAIHRMHETCPTLNIRQLMADISDGCGGCEHAMFTTPNGYEGWVSVLTECGDCVYYVLVEYNATVGKVMDAIYGTTPRPIDRAEDAFEQYLAFYRHVFEDAQGDD